MNEVKLGDVADVRISGVDKKTLPNEIPVRLCNYTDVYYNWTIRTENRQKFMLASAKEDEISKFRLHAGQVALTKDSETKFDIGHSTFISEDFEDVILGYHCALISPHPGMLDGQYLNAMFRTRHISDYLARNAGGSGQRYYLSEAAIKSIPLKLPPITTQLRIAAIIFNAHSEGCKADIVRIAHRPSISVKRFSISSTVGIMPLTVFGANLDNSYSKLETDCFQFPDGIT